MQQTNSNLLWAFRVTTSHTSQGSAWDVSQLELSNNGTPLIPSSISTSGSYAHPDYEPIQVLENNPKFWGGRPDEHGQFYLQLNFQKAVAFDSLTLTLKQRQEHFATKISILFGRSIDGTWVWNQVGNYESSGCVPLSLNLSFPGLSLSLIEPKREPKREEPLRVPPADFWHSPEKLHPARPMEFVPDSSFYNSVNVNGLWVCASKTIELEVISKCEALVRSKVPLWLLQACRSFRSARWAIDPGPLRIIILDNRFNEQAGMIPELENDTKGRNCTSCPFVFTSREDFVDGVNFQWPLGALTAHELVHGLDMVIRQVDPDFHNRVAGLFIQAKKSQIYQYKDVRGTHEMYAATNRDEFLAETAIIAMGLADPSPNREYFKSGLYLRSQLEEKDPEVVDLLSTFLNLEI